MATEPEERRLLRSADAALGCVGLYVGALGPMLPKISTDLDVPLDTAGLVLVAMAGGAVASAATVAARFHRGSQRTVALAGMLAVAAGLAGLAAVPSFATFLVFAVVVGAGGGLADAGSHGLAASSRRPDEAVSQLNRAFAIGAMVGPLWAGVILVATDDRWIVFAGLAVMAVVAAALLARARDRGGAVHGAEERPEVAWRAIPPIVLAMSALLFLYVGAEFGLGAWVASATRQAADAGVLAGALVSSGYWGALWLGRAASGRALERGWRSERILVASVAGAGAGSVLLALGGGVVALGALGALITGFCFGPIWPAAMAIATRGTAANTAAVIVTLGNAGGIVLPWLQGRVLVGAGPRTGMAMSAVLCAAMLAIALVALRRAAPGRMRARPPATTS